MTKFDVAELIDNLPAGLDRAILRRLSFHIGEDKACSREDMLAGLHNQGFNVVDRAVRAQINLLRKQGYPICSAGGAGGGYYLASGWQELNEYLTREVHSRAMDLLEQERALKEAGERMWGKYSPGRQASLF